MDTIENIRDVPAILRHVIPERRIATYLVTAFLFAVNMSIEPKSSIDMSVVEHLRWIIHKSLIVILSCSLTPNATRHQFEHFNIALTHIASSHATEYRFQFLSKTPIGDT